MPLGSPPSVQQGQTPPLQSVVVRAAALPALPGAAAFSIVALRHAVLADNARLDDTRPSQPGFSLYRRTFSLGAIAGCPLWLPRSQSGLYP